MRKSRNFLIAFILGSIIGWTLGFLRLPYIEIESSFWIGFIACLALIILILSLLFVWNKSALSIGLITKITTQPDSEVKTSTHIAAWAIVSVFIILGVLAGCFMVYKQNAMFHSYAQKLNLQIQEQSELITANQKSSQTYLMSSTLKYIDAELNQSTERTLSKAAIKRLKALSISLEPIYYYSGDSLSDVALSPGRGQLLSTLIAMNIDSVSFKQIIDHVSFSHADLHGANLSGAHLDGINLSHADLTNANLKGTQLKNANLNKSNLWGAELNKVNLSEARLKNSDLRWCNLNEANLSQVDMEGSNLTNAKLRKANLQEAILQWTILDGALLINTNMTGADLILATLIKTNLQDANLNEARLSRANLQEANFEGVKISQMAVEENWFEQLKGWRIKGVERILEEYQVVQDSSKRFKKEKHYLQKK